MFMHILCNVACRFSAEGPPLQLHTFSFSDCYPYGVGSMLWHERLSVLIVAGPNQENEGLPTYMFVHAQIYLINGFTTSHKFCLVGVVDVYNSQFSS